VKEVLDSLEQHKELLTLLVATVGGGFALWRWAVDQKWRRVQYAQSVIKQFLEKEDTPKAFEILDTLGEIEFTEDGGEVTTIKVTDEFLIGVLSTFDQKVENSDSELIVRVILDNFIDELSTFQSHIDAGLIKLQDIQPYLEYWIRELTGNGRVHEAILAGQVSKYLDYFGYQRVLTLAKNMGYPFPKGKPNEQ
jgi:hypothetical protein